MGGFDTNIVLGLKTKLHTQSNLYFFYKWFICFYGRYPISLRSPKRKLSQDTQRMTQHSCPQFAIGSTRDLASWHLRLSADLAVQTRRTGRPISCLTPPDSVPKTPPNHRSTEVSVCCLWILPVSQCVCVCVCINIYVCVNYLYLFVFFR